MDGRRARALLGVDIDADPEEIRRAFRARALATHPDRGGDRITFELVVLAFGTLHHVEITRPLPTRPELPGARPRLDVYDSAYRCRPPRDFGDVLRAAINRQSL
jgi:curved DNA-binding protein CbpA